MNSLTDSHLEWIKILNGFRTSFKLHSSTVRLTIVLYRGQTVFILVVFDIINGGWQKAKCRASRERFNESRDLPVKQKQCLKFEIDLLLPRNKFLQIYQSIFS